MDILPYDDDELANFQLLALTVSDNVVDRQ